MVRTSTVDRVLAIMTALVMIGLVPATGWAQNAAMATIEGKIVDESGGVLPGVTVTATSPALQLPQVSAVTDATGSYQLRDLPAPGLYRVSFELAGFQTYIRADMNLPVGFASRVDVTMKLGSVSETVEVSGQSPVVDVTNSARATSIDAQELRALPKGRTMQELFPMVAGLGVAGKPDVGDSQLAARAAVSTYGAALQPTMNVEGVNIATAHDMNTGMYLSSYNFSEVQFKTTGNNADVGMPGFAMEAIVKSGGNNFHGSWLSDYQNKKWQGNNITPELKAAGLTFTNPLKQYYAVAGDIGGRIVRDKLWFYGAYSKQSQTTGLISFVSGPNAAGCWTCGDAPPADVKSELPQYSTKVNAQLSQNVRVSGVLIRTAKFLSANGASATRPLPSTQVQHQTVQVWKGELSWTPTPAMAINALWGKNQSKTQYTPQPGMDVLGQPSSQEQTTRLFTGPHESPETRPSRGQPVTANVSYFTQRHQFKVGMELNFEGRNTQILKDQEHGDYLLIFNRGLPFQVVTYNYPVAAKNSMLRQSAYAMDTWKIDRFTLSYGIRANRYHAFYGDQEKPAGQLSPAASFPGQDILTWKDVVPRFGGSYDVLGSGRTVVKGTYGIFGDTMGSEYAGDFNPNGSTQTTYRWAGPCVPISFQNVSFNNTGCDIARSQLLALNPSSPDYVSATGGAAQRVNRDLKQAKIYEYTARLEQELIPNVAVSAGYVRHRINFNYGTITPLRPYSAYSVAVPLVDPLTGQTVNIYTYPSSFAGAAFNPTQHQAAEGDRPDISTTYEIAVTKRYSKRWNGSASYWATKNNKYLTSGTARTSIPASPNDDAFPTDETWNWEARAAAMYMAPFDIELSGTYRAQAGFKSQRTVNFTSPLLLQGAVTRRMEEVGAQSGPAIALANIKVAKSFKLSTSQRVEFNVQGFNLFNSSSATAVSFLTGSTFGRVTGIINPRVWRVAAEYRF
jgi:hypothetical protein